MQQNNVLTAMEANEITLKIEPQNRKFKQAANEYDFEQVMIIIRKEADLGNLCMFLEHLYGIGSLEYVQGRLAGLGYKLTQSSTYKNGTVTMHDKCCVNW